MKHKLLTFALMGALASTMLFSCKNAEEHVPVITTDSQKELVEYSISVSVPDEMRTRVTADGVLQDGGYVHPLRKIDALWWAAYYDGTILETGKETVTNLEDNQFGKFTFMLKTYKVEDPSKLFLFFWAGNNKDNITTNSGTSINNGINLNFLNYSVTVDPKYLNGMESSAVRTFDSKILDSFAGYYQFTDDPNSKVKTFSGTLTRPFSLIQILTDDFIVTNLKDYDKFSSGVSTELGFGYEAADVNNFSEQMLSPTTWYYDKYTPAEFEFDFNYSQKYVYANALSNAITFNERKMHCLACYYVFAPHSLSPFTRNIENETKALNRLNFAVRNRNTDDIKTSEFISVELPEEGLKANTKYYIYNKAREDGGTGFLQGPYTITVVGDVNWEDTYPGEGVDPV